MFTSSSLSCKLCNRQRRIHATGLRGSNYIYVSFISGWTKLNINKSRQISIGALQFYWVCQHCQNSAGAASSNNMEVGYKLSNKVLVLPWSHRKTVKPDTAEWTRSPAAQSNQCSSYLLWFISSGLIHSSFTVTVTFPLGLHNQRSIRERGVFPALFIQLQLLHINWSG